MIEVLTENKTENRMPRTVLDRPFRADQIKQRQGDDGKILDYLEGAAVIQRLNEAFGAEWSFEIVKEFIQDSEVFVCGRMTANGITKSQFGCKERERDQLIGDDLKAATTDSIKKCATLFGIGLHLYLNDAPPAPPLPAVAATFKPAIPLPVPNGARTANSNTNAVHENGNGDNPDGRVTAKQLACIFVVSKAKGWSNKDTREESIERFGKAPDYLTKKEASSFIDSLKGGTR